MSLSDVDNVGKDHAQEREKSEGKKSHYECKERTFKATLRRSGCKERIED